MPDMPTEPTNSVHGGSSPAGVRGHARIAFVTFTDEEHEAGESVFGCDANVPLTSCWIPSDHPQAQPYDLDIVHVRAERTNVPALDHVKGVIGNFRPCFILTCGTAGAKAGAKNGPRLGDLVVGDFIQYYEFAKVVSKPKKKTWSALPRHIAYDHPAQFLGQHMVQAVVSDGTWVDRIHTARPGPKGDPPALPKVHTGMILSGEKILQAYSAEEQKELFRRYDKALAVETESYGVASAVFRSRSDKQAFSHHYNPLFLPIRAVSDYVDKATAQRDRVRWTRYAAEAACAFARGIADRLLDTLPR